MTRSPLFMIWNGSIPGLAGLSHEMGLAYYKKADYPNAITI